MLRQADGRSLGLFHFGGDEEMRPGGGGVLLETGEGTWIGAGGVVEKPALRGSAVLGMGWGIMAFDCFSMLERRWCWWDRGLRRRFGSWTRKRTQEDCGCDFDVEADQASSPQGVRQSCPAQTAAFGGGAAEDFCGGKEAVGGEEGEEIGQKDLVHRWATCWVEVSLL